MRCSRCRGLMVAETYWDWGELMLTYSSFEGWRCLCCGNLWDPVIAANRHQLRPMHAGNRFDGQGGHHDEQSMVGLSA